MRIAYVVEYYLPHVGGVEVLFQHVAEGMARRGHTVTVITSQLPGTPQFDVINGVAVRRIRLPRFGTRYWFTFAAVFVLLRELRGFDLVHTTTYNAAPPSWLAAKILRKPIVLTDHEIWGTLWLSLAGMSAILGWLHRSFEWVVVRLPFAAYIGISDFTTRQIEALHSKHRHVVRIYPGIDQQLFDPSKHSGREARSIWGFEQKFVCLYYGRPGWAKGIEDLVAAWPAVLQARPDARLVLMLSRDPAKLYQRIADQIDSLNLRAVVKVVDSVERAKLPDSIRAADCVVVPSRSEGFGFSAAESSAMGVPLAVSRAGSLPEVVSGRVEFFEPGRPAEIAHAIVTIANGGGTDIPVRQFSWDETLRRHLELYQTLVPRL